MVVTSTPSNEAELQLYRVLQRASLLMYYDTLLEMGKRRDIRNEANFLNTSVSITQAVTMSSSCAMLGRRNSSK